MRYDVSKYSKCVTTNQKYDLQDKAQAGCSADARCVGVLKIDYMEFYLCTGIRTSRVRQEFQYKVFRNPKISGRAKSEKMDSNSYGISIKISDFPV